MKTSFITRTILALCATVLFLSCQNDKGDILPQHLVCEYLSNPQAIDSTSPRLEWVDALVNINTRGVYRTAYQIEAASSLQELLQGKANLWNTGKVMDSTALRISYKGRPLSAGETCWWRVKVWDQDGKESPWSEPAVWVAGLPEKEWEAQWIGVPWQGDTALDELENKITPNIYRRKRIEIRPYLDFGIGIL